MSLRSPIGPQGIAFRKGWLRAEINTLALSQRSAYGRWGRHPGRAGGPGALCAAVVVASGFERPAPSVRHFNDTIRSAVVELCVKGTPFAISGEIR